MLSCEQLAPYLVRLSDGPETIAGSIDEATLARLEAHLASCATCRDALETQRAVASVLRTRPADRVSPGFSNRLAVRLDEASGWFGIADWRAWTLRLAPVAAALALATVLGADVPAIPGAGEGGGDAQSMRPATIEEFAVGIAEAAAIDPLLWPSDVTADAVVESMVTGELPAGTGGSEHVR